MTKTTALVLANPFNKLFEDTNYEFCYEIIESRQFTYGIGWGEPTFYYLTIDRINKVIIYGIESDFLKVSEVEIKFKTIKKIKIPKNHQEHIEICQTKN